MYDGPKGYDGKRYIRIKAPTGKVHWGIDAGWKGIPKKYDPYCNYKSCGWDHYGKAWTPTDEEVTCKNCLKSWEREREDGLKWVPEIPKDIEGLIVFDDEGRLVKIADEEDRLVPPTDKAAEEFMEWIGIEMSVVWSGDENALKSWGSDSLSKIVVFGSNNFVPATVKGLEWAWGITRMFAKTLNDRLIKP